MRYTVQAPNDTGGRYLGSVLLPGLTRPSVGYSSRGKVVGYPGTCAVPVAAPAAVSQYYDNMANSGTSRTIDAPLHIRPAIYFYAGNGYGDQERAPVARVSDDQMPVPALRPPNVIVANPYVARKGGQRQVYQPQVIQRWLGMRGTPNG